MIAHVNHDLTSLAFETHRARQALDASVAKLSSGKRIVKVSDDAGGYQQAVTLGSKNRRDVATLQNLQNLVSYSHTQDGALQTVGKIIDRMNVIAMRALDITSTDADRENYDKEFLELAAQLDEIDNETFNDLKLFGAGAFSDDKKEFIESLQSSWLKEAEDVIQQRFGLTAQGADTFEVIVNENDTGGYAAFVKSSTPVGTASTANVIEMQFDLPDFAAPHTSPTSEADRTVAHELVHAVQATNFYWNALVDGTTARGGGQWFKEGTAEFIHGEDNTVKGYLGTTPTDAEITALMANIGSGDGSWSDSKQYAAAYLAVRYLHDEIKTSGIGTVTSASGTNYSVTDGVKALQMWMADQTSNNETAVNSSLNAAIAAFTSHAGNDAFIADFDGANGLAWFKGTGANKYDYSNKVATAPDADTGSIGGSDAGGLLGNLTGQDVIPDSPGAATETPMTNFATTWEEEEGSLSASRDGTGETWDLKSVNTITVSDTSTYNLKTITAAQATLTQLTDWIQNLATERSLVGANLSRLEKEIGNLNQKIATGEMAVSRIEDADVASESTKFATNQVRMQASVAILAQGRQAGVILADLIRGVQVGG